MGPGPLRTFARTAGQAGKAVRLRPSRLRVRGALVRARPGNAGLVHVGDALVSRKDPGLPPGRVLGLRGEPKIDLYDVFMVADVPGDGVDVAYAAGPLRRIPDWNVSNMIRKAAVT